MAVGQNVARSMSGIIAHETHEGTPLKSLKISYQRENFIDLKAVDVWTQNRDNVDDMIRPTVNMWTEVYSLLACYATHPASVTTHDASLDHALRRRQQLINEVCWSLHPTI